MAEEFHNDISWALGAAITSTSATSLTVASMTGTSPTATFPSSGSGASIRIRIDNEILLLTAWSGTTMTVTRGIEGSTAATHTNTTAIDCVLTTGAIINRLAGQNLSDTFANRPAAGSSSGVPGRLYLPTDGFAAFRDSGGSEANSWHAFGPVFPLVEPGSSGWSSVGVSGNSSNPVIDYTSGFPSINVMNSSGGSENITAVYQAQPSTPYTIDAVFLATCATQAGGAAAGICFLDSSNKLAMNGFVYNAGTALELGGYIWSDLTTYSGTSLFGPTLYYEGCCRFFRLKNDGTNISGWVSADGVNFVQVWTDTIGTHITPTRVGFFLNRGSTGYQMNVRLLSWYVH